ncbi:TetR/AcrR family transcriptional regulator [Luteibacter sahnii]|uniref:TetR/AcrR family transcriptional regulator n=1 Tax=Luteibacter sahnii TaxID=3021977 RepID=UPI002A6B3DFF|nr:TetR/AcrR family transcriptional regulator [Luteibacter sp. PPL193]MDY1549905.1 TetR/AcrR family transcriptional regulator [Luteibacter sp. PPL193]
MVDSIPRRGRRPGRPPSRPDGPDQRQRLIEIALGLFAYKGFAETTLASIAREAGMTPAAVHYYFKTREQLFDAVYDEHILPMRQRIGGIFESHADDPVDAFTELAERFVELAGEHRWVGPVIFGEMISDSHVFKEHIRRRFGDEERPIRLIETIRRWQSQGKLNPHLDPALLMGTVLSLTVLPMTASRRWHGDPVRGHVTPADIARHAVALLRQGLQPG